MEIVFGFLSVVLAVMTFVFALTLSRRTDLLIQPEDRKVKELLAKIDERAERQAQILKEVQASAERIAGLVRIEGERIRPPYE